MSCTFAASCAGSSAVFCFTIESAKNAEKRGSLHALRSEKGPTRSIGASYTLDLAIPTRNIVLSALVLWCGKDLGCWTIFN